MQISGLQKITLVDYPGVVAATIFTRGCSFRCPFCHNPELVLPDKFSPLMDEDKIMDFFASRAGRLQGICITGGEPLLQSDLNLFVKRVKELGFKIKLDTNGSFPEKLEALIREGNLDYIAMDIKTSRARYPEVIQVESEKNKIETSIEKSINLIMQSGIDYEFRTTICHPLHTVSDFEGIGQLIKGARLFYIQNFVSSKHVDSHIKFKPFEDAELEESLKIIKKYVPESYVR